MVEWEGGVVVAVVLGDGLASGDDAKGVGFVEDRGGFAEGLRRVSASVVKPQVVGFDTVRSRSGRALDFA